MIKRLLCFFFRHNFVMVKVDYYGHESAEHEICHYKCDRCGKKKEEMEDY